MGHTVSPPLRKTLASSSSSTISSSTLHALRSSTRANSSFPACTAAVRCARRSESGKGEGVVGSEMVCDEGSPGREVRMPAK